MGEEKEKRAGEIKKQSKAGFYEWGAFQALAGIRSWAGRGSPCLIYLQARILAFRFQLFDIK